MVNRYVFETRALDKGAQLTFISEGKWSASDGGCVRPSVVRQRLGERPEPRTVLKPD
jgi:hypothetical protein